MFIFLQIIVSMEPIGVLNSFSHRILKTSFSKFISTGIKITLVGIIGFIIVSKMDLVDLISSRVSGTYNNTTEELQRFSFYYTRQAIEIAASNPFGVGVGQTARFIQNSAGLSVGAHNIFIQLLADNGFGTFIFFFAMCINQLLFSYRIAAKCINRNDYWQSKALNTFNVSF